MGAGATAGVAAAITHSSQDELKAFFGDASEGWCQKLEAALANASDTPATESGPSGAADAGTSLDGGTIEVATPWDKETPFSIMVPAGTTAAKLRHLIKEEKGIDGCIFADFATGPLLDDDLIHPGRHRYSMVTAEPARDGSFKAFFPEGLIPGAPAILCQAPTGPVMGWLEGTIAALDLHSRKAITFVWSKHVSRTNDKGPFNSCSPAQTAPFMFLDLTNYLGFQKLGENVPGGSRRGKEEALNAVAAAEPLNREELFTALFARKEAVGSQDPLKMPPVHSAMINNVLGDLLGSGMEPSTMAGMLLSRFGGTEVEYTGLQSLLESCVKGFSSLEAFLMPPGAAAKVALTKGHNPKKLWESFATRPTKLNEGEVLYVRVEEDTNRDDDDVTTIRVRRGTFQHTGNGNLECALNKELMAKRIGYTNEKMFGETPTDKNDKVHIKINNFIIDCELDPSQGIQRFGWSSDMNDGLKKSMLETPKTLGWGS